MSSVQSEQPAGGAGLVLDRRQASDGGSTVGGPAGADPVKTVGAVDRNASIQCLRGLAALCVMLFHASFYAELLLGDSRWLVVFGNRFGVTGVAVFFAISGMLMADLVRRTDPWRFLGHRIVRIYPAFLVAVAIAMPLSAFVGGYRQSFHLLSLLLVPVGRRPYYLGVEWTLVFECTYYVALFVIAAAGWHRYLNRIALAWLAVIAAAPLVMAWQDTMFVRLYSLWLAPANAAFAGGLLVPWLIRRVRIPVGTGVVACVIILTMPPGDPALLRFAAGVAAVLLVVDAVRVKIPRRAVPSLYMLGDWSYALYLVHVPAVTAVYQLWPKSAGTGVAWLSAVAVALLLSAGMGIMDLRFYQQLRAVVNDLDERALRRRVNAYVGVFIIAALIGVAAI